MLPNPDYKARGPKHTARGQRELSFGLCLSGGGFRATLFQLGVMMGLHRVGLLERVDAISAVSGGSILAATYGLARSRAAAAGRTFDFIGFVTNLDAAIARGVRNQALARLANPTFFLRWLSKGATRTDLLAEAYDRVFFEGATLSDLPASPAILLNTTCLNNGQR
jgi:NTE family protein